MNIVKKTSPNYTAGRTKNGVKYVPDMIVCHITEGSYAGAVSWLCNPKSVASAHFVISRKGEVTQLVDIKDAAWANGTTMDHKKTNYYYYSTSSIVRSRSYNANYYTVSIELEGTTATTAGHLTDAQFNALVEVIKYIKTEVKRIYDRDLLLDRAHIIGHNEISPKGKPYCPGVNFPWTELMEALNPTETNKSEVEVTSTVIDIFKDGKVEQKNVYRVLYNGTNFIKLRDICGLCGIEVGYTDKPYIVITKEPNASAITLQSDSVVKPCAIDVKYPAGTKCIKVNAINVDGTNYVKFRDLGCIMGVTVGYNSNTKHPSIDI